MPLNTIQALVAESLEAVNALIMQSVQSPIHLINAVGLRIVQSGGKRLRPLVLLLSAQACEYKGDQHIQLAAVIEFIHTATLLHDDVVDHAELRRGQQTANHLWGNEAAILVGDFLYSRAMQMMVKLKNTALMKLVADAVNLMSEGEILQLLDRHNQDLSEGAYLGIIQSKTAKLFETAAALGAMLATTNSEIQTAMTHYGMHLGMAFQLMDDVLDYQASANTMGKMPGNDLLEGKFTLPLIHALQQASTKDGYLLKEAIAAIQRQPRIERDEKSFSVILDILEKTKAIEYTTTFARREVKRASDALKRLPSSPYREALVALAQFAVNRVN